MEKMHKTNVRKKIIGTKRIVIIMKANINLKTNNPNFTKVNNFTGVDRKTLKRWWDKNEANVARQKMRMMKMTMTMKKSIVKLPKK
jgi:hypothetical protein